MTRIPTPRDPLPPRLLTMAQLAGYLGIDRTTLLKQMPSLKKTGFPTPLPAFALYDRKVIDLWLDHASGITADGRYSYHPIETRQIGSKFAPVRQTTVLPKAKRSGNPYTVAEAVDEYLTWYRAHHQSPSRVTYTLEATILPHFGHRRVEDLTPPQIRAWHEALAQTPRTKHVGYGKPRQYLPPPSTDEAKRKRRISANGDLTVLKAVLNFAVREGKVHNDAAWRVVQKFKGVLRSDAPHLTLAECQKLLPLLSPDFRLLVCGALFTGARLMELTRLAAEDFDPASGSVYFAPAKTKWSRHAALSDEGRAFFADRVANLLPTDLIFRRQDGHAWRPADPCHRLAAPCKAAGLRPITFHSFRHTYATLLAEGGASLAAIAKSLGHRQVEVCERYYAHVADSYVASQVRDHMPKIIASAV